MFKISKKEEAIKDTDASTFIGKSGIYDVVINFVSVEVTKNGATQVNFNISYNGNDQVIYGPYIYNRDGSENKIGIQLMNKLGIIAGMEDGEQPDIQQEVHNVGKDNKPVEFNVITQFSDLPVKMRVQEEYTKYNGEIRSRLVIKSFFAENGASAEEIVKSEEPGARLALEQEKYASNVTYRDGLTPEEVEEWKANKRSNTSTPKPAQTNTPARKLFGQK